MHHYVIRRQTTLPKVNEQFEGKFRYWYIVHKTSSNNLENDIKRKRSIVTIPKLTSMIDAALAGNFLTARKQFALIMPSILEPRKGGYYDYTLHSRLIINRNNARARYTDKV